MCFRPRLCGWAEDSRPRRPPPPPALGLAGCAPRTALARSAGPSAFLGGSSPCPSQRAQLGLSVLGAGQEEGTRTSLALRSLARSGGAALPWFRPRVLSPSWTLGRQCPPEVLLFFSAPSPTSLLPARSPSGCHWAPTGPRREAPLRGGDVAAASVTTDLAEGPSAPWCWQGAPAPSSARVGVGSSVRPWKHTRLYLVHG